MLALVLKLIDNLVKLAEQRDQLSERTFVRFVDPTYRNAGQVYRNFIKALGTLESKLKRAKNMEPLLRFLKAERLELLSVRSRYAKPSPDYGIEETSLRPSKLASRNYWVARLVQLFIPERLSEE